MTITVARSAPASARSDTIVGPRRCRTRPSGARRVGARPRPRVRPLAEVLAELVRPRAGACPAVPAVPAVPVAAAPAAPPDPRPVALRVLRAVAEILEGRRPVTHLRPVCDGELYSRVVEPLGARATRAPVAGQVRGVRVCPVAARAVEVSAVVHREGRARALAARLEHDGRTWRVVALEIG